MSFYSTFKIQNYNNHSNIAVHVLANGNHIWPIFEQITVRNSSSNSDFASGLIVSVQALSPFPFTFKAREKYVSYLLSVRSWIEPVSLFLSWSRKFKSAFLPGTMNLDPQAKHSLDIRLHRWTWHVLLIGTWKYLSSRYRVERNIHIIVINKRTCLNLPKFVVCFSSPNYQYLRAHFSLILCPCVLRSHGMLKAPLRQMLKET